MKIVKTMKAINRFLRVPFLLFFFSFSLLASEGVAEKKNDVIESITAHWDIRETVADELVGILEKKGENIKGFYTRLFFAISFVVVASSVYGSLVDPRAL